MESTSYVLSFRMVFFLPCDHGLDFFLHQLLFENSINRSINYIFIFLASTCNFLAGKCRDSKSKVALLLLFLRTTNMTKKRLCAGKEETKAFEVV